MIFYFFIVLCIFVLGKIYDYYKKDSRNIFFFVFFLVSGLRSINVGNDTVTYVDLYTKWSYEGRPLLINTRIEKGYVLFNWILSRISTSPQLLLIATSFFVNFFLFWFIYKYSHRPYISVVIYFLLRFFYGSMNTIRVYMALSFLYLAYDRLVRNKKKSFLLYVVIASFFHKTALIFLLLLLFSRVKISYKNMLVMFIFVMLLTVFFNDIILISLKLFPEYSVYLGGNYFSKKKLSVIVQFLLSCLIFIYIFSISKKHKKEINSVKLNLDLWMIYFVALINFLALNANIISRLSLYFSAFIPVIMVNETEKLDKKRRCFYYYIILIVLLVYHFVVLYYRPEWNRVYPYEISNLLKL